MIGVMRNLIVIRVEVILLQMLPDIVVTSDVTVQVLILI